VQFIFLLGAFVFIPLYVLCGEHQRRKRLRNEVYELLQTLILRLGAGESLPSALLSVQKSCGRDMQQFLANEPSSLMDRRLFQTQQELNEIKKYLHQALLRLRWLRESWETEDQFEQKRRRATSMIRAQAGLLCVLYVGLLIFTTSRYEYYVIRTYVHLSLIFFMMGIFALLLLGRSFRWKV
jgi:Flp pilus assembly protein TadB